MKDSISREEFVETITMGAIGFAYTQKGAVWFRRTGESPMETHDHADLSSAFVIRWFDTESDYSWEQVDSKSGVECGGKVPHGARATRFFLWGEVTEVKDGWALLSESRIKDFWVPVGPNIKLRQQLQLVAAESFEEDDFGNASISATHLIRIEARNGE